MSITTWTRRESPDNRPSQTRSARGLLTTVVLAMLLASCAPRTEQEMLQAAEIATSERDLATAVVQLKQTLQKFPESAEARFRLGEALFATGNAPSAVFELEKARAAGFDDAKTLPLLARALLAAVQPQRVLTELADVKLEQPFAQAELLAMVGAAHAALGELEQAEAAARSALSANPKDSAARQLMARLSAGKGDFATAGALVASLVEDHPNQREIRLLQGELLWRADRDLKRAEAAFRQAITIDRAFLPAHSLLLALLLERGNLDAYRAQVKQLEGALPSHPETTLYRARLALLDNDLAQARELAQNLLRIAPENATALELAGSVELRRNALVLAETHLSKAVQRAPGAALPRQLLAEAQIRAGEPQRALAALRPLLHQNASSRALSLAGQAQLLLGDAAGAEALFARAAAVSPDDVQIQTVIALRQIAAGSLDTGMAQLDRLSAQDEAQTHADMARISARIDRREWPQALEAIDRLTEKAPTSALPFHLRGQVLLQLKDSAGARLAWERALGVDPAFFEASAALAMQDLSEGNLARAQQRVDAFLQANPRDGRAMTAIAELRRRAGAPPEEVQRLLVESIRASAAAPAPRLLLIDHHLAQGNLGAALTTAQEAVAALPEDPMVLDALGRVHLAAGDSEQAINTFNRIVAANPGSPQPLLRLADAHTRLRNYAAARQVLKRALESSPRLIDAQRELARVALLDGKSDEALEIARTVQRHRTAEPIGYLMESEIHAGQKRWPAAIAAARTALERQRSSWTAVHLHAQLVAAGRGADASRFADDWLREQPADADFLMHLGSAAMVRRAYAEAEARFRDVLTHRSRDPVALNNVAWTMLQQGKPGARVYAERASEVAPNDPALLDTLAMALLSEGQTARALEIQRRAVARAQNAPQIDLNLALILIESGDRAGARAILTRLSQLGGRFDRQDEVAKLQARAQ